MTITCKICGVVNKNKFPMHLRLIHCMTKEEYDEKYPIILENPKRCKFCDKALPVNKQHNTYCGHSCHTSEMVRDSKFGWSVVWDKHPDMMAENLDKIVHDPEFLKEQSERATKRNLDPDDPFGKECYNFSPEARDKISVATTRRNLDPNSGIGWRNLNKTPEFKEMLSRTASEKNADPNSGFGFGNLFKEEWFQEDQDRYNNDPEIRKIRSETAKRLNVDDNSDFGKQGYGIKGYHESKKVLGGSIFYASSWEFRAFKILDIDNEVASYERGPTIPYLFEDIDHMYLSDILVTYINGSKRIIEVKRDDHKFFEVNKAKYKAACLYSKEMKYLPFKVWDSKYIF
jgi:hypothetical protein